MVKGALPPTRLVLRQWLVYLIIMNKRVDGNVLRENQPSVGLCTVGASGSTFGRNAELISPMPTKKSSFTDVSSGLLGDIVRRLTRDNFNQVWTPLPDIRPIVDDDDHRCIAGEKSL
jgi:hypothetical protein